MDKYLRQYLAIILYVMIIVLYLFLTETADFIGVAVTTNFAGSQNIQLSAVDDDMANEGDERFTLNYVHNLGSEFVVVVERGGEFLRETATVIIIDNDCK